MLIDYGANVNARDFRHWTPIHFSVGTGDLDMAKLLLERSADVHAMNDKGETPLHQSLRIGDPEVTDLLREHGAGRPRFEETL